MTTCCKSTVGEIFKKEGGFNKMNVLKIVSSEQMQSILEGGVTIRRVKKDTKEGYPYALLADIQINNPDCNDIKFTWIRNDSFPDRARINNPIYYLSKDMIGEEIKCRITADYMEGTIISEPYLITESDFVLHNEVFVDKNSYKVTTEDNGNNEFGKQRLKGFVNIEKCYTASIYKSKYNDGVALKADVVLEEDIDIANLEYRWGYVYDIGPKAGQICELNHLDESPNLFWCRKKDLLGKTYRCEIRCKGYYGVISAEYGPICEVDFIIPFEGEVSIGIEPCMKKEHINEVVVKADAANLNINEKPNYTWLIGEKRIFTGTDSRISITEVEISKTIQCEISHESRTGFKSSEPLVITHQEYNKAKLLLEKRKTEEKIEKHAQTFYKKLNLFNEESADFSFENSNLTKIVNLSDCKNLKLKVPNIKKCAFTGVMTNGKPNGYGILNTESASLEGIWKNGKLNAYGIIRSKCGWSYEGSLKNSLPEGSGKLKLHSGEVYDGLFKKGMVLGIGKLVLPYGEIIEEKILKYLKNL